MRQDHAITLQPGQHRKTLSQRKKSLFLKHKETYLEECTSQSSIQLRLRVKLQIIFIFMLACILFFYHIIASITNLIIKVIHSQLNYI